MRASADEIIPAVLAEILRFAQNDDNGVRGLGTTSQQATLLIAIPIGIADLAMI